MDANWQVGRHVGEACRRAKKHICTQYSDAKLKQSDADIDLYSTYKLLQSWFYQVKSDQIQNSNQSSRVARLNLHSSGVYLLILVFMSQTKTPWAILVKTYSTRSSISVNSNKKCHWINPKHNNVITVCPQDWYIYFDKVCWRNNYYYFSFAFQ